MQLIEKFECYANNFDDHNDCQYDWQYARAADILSAFRGYFTEQGTTGYQCRLLEEIGFAPSGKTATEIIREQDEEIESLQSQLRELADSVNKERAEVRALKSNNSALRADIEGMSRGERDRRADSIGDKKQVEVLIENFRAASKGYADALVKIAELEGDLASMKASFEGSIK